MMNDFGGLISKDQFDLDMIVCGVSILLPVGFIVLLAAAPSTVKSIVSSTSTLLLQEFGWGFQAVLLVAVAFVGVITIGPWGRIRLGGPGAAPEFSYPTYFSMVFSAGIAAGIVFWGPAEAIYHYDVVPPTVPARSGSLRAAVSAIRYTLFHWGISAWSAYLAIGLPVAFFAHNRGAPLRVSSVLTPFLGTDRFDSYWAKSIDILAVVATVGGMTATLGFVSSQFLTGIEYNWGVEFGDGAVIIFMLALVLVFTVSAVTGVYRGIKRLSFVNIGGFILLSIVTLLVGPTEDILTIGGNAIVGYTAEFISMSTTAGSDWAANWTIFYWSWWLSWAPFVGLFIASISYGRTIREVVLVSAIGSSLTTIAWFIVMGVTAISLQRSHSTDVLMAISEVGVAVSAFPVFEALPLGDLLLGIFLGLVITFLVTSADSSTLSIAILTTGEGSNPSRKLRAIWGSIQAVLAAVLIVGSSSDIVRSAAVLTGGPIALLAVVAMLGMLGEVVKSCVFS